MKRLALIFAAVTATVSLAHSQAPQFAVASIKPDLGQNPNSNFRELSHGRMNIENFPLKMIIGAAYKLRDYQITGGPDWINSDGYNVTAKADGDATADQMWPMLQTLLMDRFQLKVHRETRELPVYVLTAAKSGIRLPEPKDTCSPCGFVRIKMQPTSVQLQGGKVSMAALTSILVTALGRPVIDKTGFKGTFDVDVEFNRDQSLEGLHGPQGRLLQPQAPGDPQGPSIFTALQEKLGLKLDSAKGPVEVLIIDHVERPNAN